MKEYIIAMKSGAMFCVKIEDYREFIIDMKKRKAPLGSPILYENIDGIVFDINDISAIYPKESDARK